jgi:hypothetical protein
VCVGSVGSATAVAAGAGVLLFCIIALTMSEGTEFWFNLIKASVDKSKFVFEVWIFVMITSLGNLALTISKTVWLVTTSGWIVAGKDAAGGAFVAAEAPGWDDG